MKTVNLILFVLKNRLAMTHEFFFWSKVRRCKYSRFCKTVMSVINCKVNCARISIIMVMWTKVWRMINGPWTCWIQAMTQYMGKYLCVGTLPIACNIMLCLATYALLYLSLPSAMDDDRVDSVLGSYPTVGLYYYDWRWGMLPYSTLTYQWMSEYTWIRDTGDKTDAASDDETCYF